METNRGSFFLILLSFCFSLIITSIAKGQDWPNEDKEIWKKAVKRVVTIPPCCGACSVFSMRDGRLAYKYVIGEDKSEEAAKVYKDHESKLKEAFRYFSPERFEYWFGQSKKEKIKNEK